MSPPYQYQRSNQRFSLQFGLWSRCGAATRNLSKVSKGGTLQCRKSGRSKGAQLQSVRREAHTALANVRKYQESLKRYYNKSVIQRELNIGDLVLKKDIRTKDKHKFSLPWEGLFIIVDIVAPGAYVLAKIDGGMLPNTWNPDQLHKYYA
jgi:hypothetical protein